MPEYEDSTSTARDLETAPSSIRAGRTADRALTADVVRVALFLGVIVSHTISTANYTPDVLRSTGLANTLLHVTRYGFVAVTLFVLVLSTTGRAMSPTAFWRRRFGLVVWPYLVWTVVYSFTDHLLVIDGPFPPAREFVTDLGRTVFTGDAKYQLYFLLISMQIYLLFPALAWLAGRIGGHPWRVVTGAAAAQLAMFAAYEYAPRPADGFWAKLLDHAWKLLPMYVLFVVIGMLAAHHHREIAAWLRAHVPGVVVVAGLATAFSVVAYLRATSPDDVPVRATDAWNPLYLPWYVAGVVLLWLAATLWDGHRPGGRRIGERAVTVATKRAFGAYASHPLMLDVLTSIGLADLLYRWFPASAALRTAVMTALVLVMVAVFVEAVLRTPVSRFVVARDRIRRRARTDAPTVSGVRSGTGAGG